MGYNMDKTNRMLTVFESSGILLNDNLSSCKLNALRVNDATSTWRFCLTFDNVLSFSELKNMIEKVSDYVKSNFEIKNVKFTIDYPGFILNGFVIDNKDLKNFYNYAIDVCMVVKKGVMILKEY